MAYLTKFRVGDKVRGTACDIRGYEGIIERITDAGYVIRLTTNGQWGPKVGWRKGDICGTISFWESFPGTLELLSRPHCPMGLDWAEGYPSLRPSPSFGGAITTVGSIAVCGTTSQGLERVDGSSLTFPNIAELMYTTTKTNKQITIMDKITTFAKNLTLSAEEKALRKVGLKTECGDYTKSAESIIIQLICKEREASLVEIANKMIEEDKDTK